MSGASRPESPPLPPANSGAGDRLDTWKEIAAYLGRDVRTAKRWERTRGMPVHRLPGGPKAAVYAIRTELELWRQGAGDDPTAESPQPAPAPSRRALWAGAAAVLLSVCAVVFFFRDPPTRLRVTPLTSYRGVEWFPSLSPDGKLVAFSWNGEQQGNYDLYVNVIDAGTPLRITTDPEMEIAPVWSPDGRRIAFLRWGLGAPTFQHVVIPALGGQERIVARGRVTTQALGIPFPASSWTPDGTRLIFAEARTSDGAYALTLAPIAGGETTPLTAPPPNSPGDCCTVVSPDGRLLAFLRGSPTRERRVFVLNINRRGEAAGEPRPIGPPSCLNPFWSADGNEVLCVAGDTVDRRIWRLPVRPGWRGPREVSSTFGLTGRHLTSRGNLLVYSNFAWQEDIWEWSAEKGHPQRRLLDSTGDDQAPDISPDGKRIAFVSTRSGHLAVWTSQRDGANPAELAPAAAPHTPRWSPTGEEIAFTCRTGTGPEQICRISANGGQPLPFTRANARHSLPSWSRDGKWVYYACDASGSFQTWKAPLDASSPPVRVSRDGGYGVLESADGRTLFFAKPLLSSPLYRMPAQGGGETALGEEIRSLRLPMNFAVGPEAVYFAWSRNPAQWFELRSYSLATGEARVIQRIDRGLGNGIAIAPDGHSLLFTTTELNAGDLFLVDNFR
ncbi:MAG: PD40 domain-containing protein [Bryobacterales bacterium]|nr:PD40 domain-containing protein [Bryobacterales bacterium]